MITVQATTTLTPTGVDDDDGCPDLKVQLDGAKIIVHQRILFHDRKARIRLESFAILDDVVRILDENPRIRRVRIEGHTGGRGSRRAQQRLSEARAQEVLAYLVKMGIDPYRLEAVGMGATQPLVAPELTDADRQANQRVEFVVVESD